MGEGLRIQPQVAEDLLDHRLLEKGGNDPELAAAAVRTLLPVDVKNPLEQLHQPVDDRAQQRMQFVVGGRARFEEGGRAIGAAAVNAVQHQAMEMYLEVGGGPQTLDLCGCAAMASVNLETGAAQQLTRDDALYHLQHRRDQLGLRGQQHGCACRPGN